MKKVNKKNVRIITKIPIRKEIKNNFKIRLSQYSNIYRKYMIKEFPLVETMIRKIIKMPFCEKYYLHYPLENLIKGAIKRMLLNSYQTIVFGYFLQQISEWRIGSDILLNVSEIFPDIIHVNEPTDINQLKQISMFLYFSSYSIKQLLNPNMQIYKRQMQKLFPDFDHLLTHWVNSQHTVNFCINPRLLNEFAKKMQKKDNFLDFNTCVDKIIHISPCYDINNKGKNKSQQLPQFGYMQNGYSLRPAYDIADNQQVKMEQNSDIDIMDFKYDGDVI